MKINTVRKIRLFFLLGIGLLYFSCTSKPEYVLKESFDSPNQEYTLELHIEKDYEVPISLSSESAYRSATVVLRDKDKNILLKSGIFNQCKFVLTDFKLDWKLAENKIYFTKFNFIDLTNNTFDCY